MYVWGVSVYLCICVIVCVIDACILKSSALVPAACAQAVSLSIYIYLYMCMYICMCMYVCLCVPIHECIYALDE